MTDYGRPVRFGCFLVPEAHPTRPLELAELADGLGLDYVGVQDHPYQPRFHDTWTLLAAIAARTRTIRVFPDVVALPLRPPAVLAKAAATLDVLSGGRVELGLGAGGFLEAAAAMGAPKWTRGESAAALEEAIRVIRLMWSGERSVRFKGAFYRLDGVRPGPQPAHPIGIWLGVRGPRNLALTGRLADGWVPSIGYLPPSGLAPLHARIDEAAQAAGRDPAEIQRVYNLGGLIADRDAKGLLDGPVDHWAETLAELTLERGMDTYVFGPREEVDSQLRRFSLEVAPRVRELVEAGRRGSGRTA